MTDMPPEVVKVLPGAVGSAVSLYWAEETETWTRRFGMFAAGVAISYYCAPWVARNSSLEYTVAGFLLGLLGMMLADKAIETWRRLEIGTFVAEWLRKVAGLPPTPPTQGPRP